MTEPVSPIAPLTLQVGFADGTLGHVRFEPSHLTGVFEALQNPGVFAQAHIEHGAVTWPGHIDLAPDAMCHHIKAHGQWVLV